MSVPVFELCEKGAIMKLQANTTCPYYDEAAVRHYFRGVILGVEYCT